MESAFHANRQPRRNPLHDCLLIIRRLREFPMAGWVLGIALGDHEF